MTKFPIYLILALGGFIPVLMSHESFSAGLRVNEEALSQPLLTPICVASNSTMDEFGPLPCDASNSGLNFIESDGDCFPQQPCEWKFIQAYVSGCNASAATLHCNASSQPIVNGSAVCNASDIQIACGAMLSGLIEMTVRGSGGGALAGKRVSLSCGDCDE